PVASFPPFASSGWVIQISTSLEDVHDLLRSYRLALGAAITVTILVGLGFGLPLTGFALRPLRRLTRNVAEVSPDSLEERVPIPQAPDGVRGLAVAFTPMM